MSRPLALTIGCLAALGAAVLGAFVYDRLHLPVPAPVLTARTAPAAPAPTIHTEISTEAIPALRPVFSLPDPAGKVHSIGEWDGKALVVNFWATWCAPCRREIPLLARIRSEYAAKGVEVVGIAVDVPAEVNAYLVEHPIPYPVLVGEQSGIDVARDFGVDAQVFPFTAFTDSRGRIITIRVGELHEAMARAILGVVLKVDAGALTPAQARAAIKTTLAALPESDVAPAG